MFNRKQWAQWGLLPLLFSNCASLAKAQDSPDSQWPIHSTEYTKAVEWDHYSLLIKGERIFLFSGEMHPFRLPVPELWEDILQKTKALGLNGVSFYNNWYYNAPQPDILDFNTTGRDLSKWLEFAKENGLWVSARPGPYVNAELSAGGFPLWLTTGAYGTLRNNDTRYTEAWTPYQDAICDIVKPYQVHKDGTVIIFQIENEYGDQWTNVAAKTPDEEAIQYMELLEANAIANDIEIPLTHNNPNLNTWSWSKDYDTVGAGGDVDIYGIDSYPNCWSCDPNDCGTNYVFFQVADYYDNFQTVSPTQVSYIPEFQGGMVNPVYGPAGGCASLADADTRNLYYRHNIEEKVTAVSLYMVFGGTSWGWSAVPWVSTSYDYEAPISEDRSLWDAYYETKSIALFTRVAADLRLVDRLGNGTSYTTNVLVSATELRNAENDAGFYVTRHTDSTQDDVQSFQLHVKTSVGNFTVPQKAPKTSLNGHQSKIIVTDFHFADKTLIYSTAEVLTYSVFDNEPTLVLWVPTGESGEFYLKGAHGGTVLSHAGSTNITFSKEAHGVLTAFTQNTGLSVLKFDNLRVLLVDRTAAYTTWVPALTSDPSVPVDQTVIVQGPYLVRGASMEHNTLVLTGDTTASTSLEVFASKKVQKITWNGKTIQANCTTYGSFKASLEGPSDFELPALGSWKVKDSLPEIQTNYSDAGPAWVDANHTTTVSPITDATIPYLFLDEYGFHNGISLWRGYFNGSAEGAFLSVQGGEAFGWSAYLNGEFVDSDLGGTDSETNLTLSFSDLLLSSSGPNVLTVIQDNSGHDETSGATNVRGILNATLLGSSSGFSKWKVAGTAGGSTNTTLDLVRGSFNEGGLTAERLGWHLPGFDDSAWPSASPADGFQGATVKFYRTTVPLNVPDNLDVAVSFTLDAQNNTAARALLFVNGYQYGRFVPHVSNATAFPVPPGVLNYNGDNLIGLAVWAQTEAGANVAIDWKVTKTTASSFNFNFDSDYLRPGWDAVRLQYA